MESYKYKFKETYLNQVIDKLPSRCLLNKGITGCGGTTVELESKRDSIILCPTRNLVTSKSSLGYFGVDGKVTKKDIKFYLNNNNNSYKKIVATYDALPKLMDSIPNYKDYFLLIDEYHLLFNDYSFRGECIKFILHNFKKFKDWCFMTATPLKEEFILEELKDIPQVTYEWKNSTPVNIHIEDTYYIQKSLLKYIEEFKDKNLHIFLNSISTIYNITKNIDESLYRVVCSESSKTKITNFSKVTSPVKKLNFYTSCAFEGCLLPGQKVLTDKGLLNCEDVTIQNKLVNKNGKLVDIYNLQKYEKVNEDVYTIRLGNTFRTTTFTKIHPILVSEHPAKYPFKFKECKDIKKGDWVVYPNYYSKVKQINLNWWDQFKNLTNKEHINPLELSDFWWFIGLFLGDGWTQNDGYRVFISVNKDELLTLNRLRNFCKLLNRSYRLKDKQGCFEIIINDKQLVDFLNYYMHKGAECKRIPEIFKFIKPEYKISLLNGYLDSDGCIINSNNNYRASFVSINLELLEDIQDILTSLGIKSSLKKLRNPKQMKIKDRTINCHTTYDLNISHNDLYLFKTLNSDTFYQKLQKIQEIKPKSRIPKYVSMEFSNNKKFVCFKIKDITKIQYSGLVYNFECDTHTYCCRHMITHNCDIYDPNGLCIIICDTQIATTVLDIATKIRQVCGRLRDSKYKNECYLILNTSKHRYANTSKKEFEFQVSESERLGRIKHNNLHNTELTEDEKNIELKLFSKEKYATLYLNKYQNDIYFDENLKKMDIYNYNLISEIYSTSISVIGEFEKFNTQVKTKPKIENVPSWILEHLTKNEYTYNELETIFTPIFEQHGLKWNKKTSIKYNFPPFTKKQKVKNHIKSLYYIFNIF